MFEAPSVARGRESLSRQSPAVWVACAVLAGLAVLVIFGPLIAPYDPNATNLSDSLAPPSPEHWLGTDASGRDILSRLIAGARPSLAGPLIVVLISTLVGVPMGLLAGYRGGRVDAALARSWDVVFAFPPLLLAIVIVATFGVGFWSATLAISVVYVPIIARVVRGVAIAERTKAYVVAAQVQGISDLRIAAGHILPNVSPTIAAQTTVNFGYALMELAGLAFLGLGVQPPTPDWGAMLVTGRDALLLDSYGEVVGASIAIAVSVVSFNIAGSALFERAGDARQ